MRSTGPRPARTLQSTVVVLDAARRGGSTKVIVTVPGAALYGPVAAKDQPVKEGHEWTPLGLRGVLARAVVDLLGVYRNEHEVEHTTLVLGSVYGPRQRTGVVAAFAAGGATGPRRRSPDP